MNIALVTDSTADIPVELIEKNQIHVVPNLIIIDGDSIEDGKDISRQEFYDRLPTMKVLPTTAAASAGSFQKIYEYLLSQGVQKIISIHASSLLSGIFNAARLAAQTFGERVHVIDSGQVTLGLGFQVLAAAEAIASGLPLEAIFGLIADASRRAHVFALLDTLEYIRRSGRISWARARLGSLLQIKPLLEVRNGQVFSLGDVRTRQKGIERLREFILRLGPLERLAILHTNAEADARRLLESLDLKLNFAPLIVHATTVIGTHVGPHGLGAAAITK